MGDQQRGVDRWTEQTTAFDRVLSIAQAVDRPRTAGYIAAEAAVSETTAHNHLKRLVEMNLLRTVRGEDATLYAPDPLYIRFQTLHSLIDEHSHEELVELRSGLQQRIEELEETYDVTSPTELRERATATETSAKTVELLEDASDWELTEYHLSLVDDAIENYREYEHADQAARA